MAIGTVFTLYFVPALYLLIARQRVASSESEGRDGEASGHVPVPVTQLGS
ncbi:hypothetical protein [Pyxidicoccus sp. MSG2]|nr:hypothetical protein [Pyxidicoccus sp. MSG2]MCY1014602.1 hypothetical protein [Pyxidicoccus sp. MSG2]